MLPLSPREWPDLFEMYLDGGDLEAKVALYASDATFVPNTGEPIRSRDAIRTVLADLIDRKARLRDEFVKAVVAGDTAVLYTDWCCMVSGAVEHSRPSKFFAVGAGLYFVAMTAGAASRRGRDWLLWAVRRPGFPGAG